jgi:dipeptidyl aminopeptidase/acylaminoacyl peptidase
VFRKRCAPTSRGNETLAVSFFNDVEKINKPMMVVAGKNDPRVPVSESDQMVAALKKQGTAIWYVMARDEGHGFQKKAVILSPIVVFVSPRTAASAVLI